MKAQIKSVPVAALTLFALIGCKPPDPELPKYCELPENTDQPECDPDASFAAVIGPEHAAVSTGLTGLVRVFGMGDVNGDGTGDLAVVADTLQILDGATLAPLVSFSAGLGRQLTVVGDVDGDGLDDVVVGDGAERWLFPGSSLTGGSNLENRDAVASFVGSEGREILAVAGGGDVDGDGRADFVISEFNEKDSGRSNEEIRVVSGKSIGAGKQNLADFESAFGAVVDGRGTQSLTIFGDYDGDGLDDIAAGAVRNFAAVHPSNNFGGGPFGGISDREVHVQDCHPGEDCPNGAWVGAVGDVDFDGIGDLLVTAFPNHSAWVIPGNALVAKLYETKAFSGTWAEAREIVGASDLAAAGDFDGNGVSDIIATTPDGQIWLIGGHQLTGTRLVLPADIAAFEAESSPTVSHGFAGFGDGAKAIGVGDLDGNGLDDIAVWTSTELFLLHASSAAEI